MTNNYVNGPKYSALVGGVHEKFIYPCLQLQFKFIKTQLLKFKFWLHAVILASY